MVAGRPKYKYKRQPALPEPRAAGVPGRPMRGPALDAAYSTEVGSDFKTVKKSNTQKKQTYKKKNKCKKTQKQQKHMQTNAKKNCKINTHTSM